MLSLTTAKHVLAHPGWRMGAWPSVLDESLERLIDPGLQDFFVVGRLCHL